jgi:hypothetical protein
MNLIKFAPLQFWVLHRTFTTSTIKNLSNILCYSIEINCIEKKQNGLKSMFEFPMSYWVRFP